MPSSPSPSPLPSSPDTSTSALGSDVAPSSCPDGANLSQTDISLISAPDGIVRRPSIQFNTAGSEARLRERSQSSKKDRSRPLRRLPSPPPPSSYNRGVSFDTFDNRDATDYSLTLNYKHKNYHSTRRSRTFLCGTDQNDYSDFALEWLMDELVDDGDEIVCLRVVERDSKLASDSSVENGRYRQEAEKLFQQVIAKNSHDEKAISLVMELAVGKVQEIIQRMIQIYEPAALIVGTRGRSLGGVQGLLPGSVSKYCLQQSPIPVIVVRPTQKRQKKKQKRLADPTRRSYNQIMRLSQSKGDRIFDTASANSSSSRLPEHEEAAAVAEAIARSSSNVMDLHEARASKRSSRDYSSSQASDAADTESIGQKSPKSASHSATPSLDMSSVVLTSPGLPDEDSPVVSMSEGCGDHTDFTDDSSRITPMSTMASDSTGIDDHIRALAPGPEVHVTSPSGFEGKKLELPLRPQGQDQPSGTKPRDSLKDTKDIG